MTVLTTPKLAVLSLFCVVFRRQAFETITDPFDKYSELNSMRIIPLSSKRFSLSLLLPPLGLYKSLQLEKACSHLHHNQTMMMMMFSIAQCGMEHLLNFHVHGRLPRELQTMTVGWNT